MKKSGHICLILCLALLLGCLAVPVWADETTDTTGDTTAATGETVEVTVPVTPEELPDYSGQDASVVAGCRTIEAMSSLNGTSRLLATANAALLFEINSGTMVYAYNPDTAFEASSFVKVMTALLAFEKGDLDAVITVKESVLDTVSSDIMYPQLEDGEELTLRDLLNCMLVGSSNDAAAVIAEYIGGSQENFVSMMNQRAAELGCTNTNFVNPHGIYDSQQYTTARDIARIVMEATQYEEFCAIWGDDYAYIEETNLGNTRGLYSRNYMIGMYISEYYYDYRVTGGRTATSSADRRSFVSTFEDGDLSYVCVVVEADPMKYNDNGTETDGTHHDFMETQELLDLGLEGYAAKQVLKPGQITTRFTVVNGANDVAAGPNQEVTTLLPSGVDFDDLTLRYLQTNGTLNAPVEAGTRVDTVQVWYGSVCVAQAGLVTMNSAKVSAAATAAADQSEGDRLGTGVLVFFVVVGVIVGAAAVLYIIRFVRTGLARSRRRKRRRNRRRSL